MKTYLFIILILSFWSCKEKSNSNNSYEKQAGFVNKSDDVALDFINSYVKNCNKMSDAQGVVEWINNNVLVTDRFKSELIAEVKKSDPELGLDSDPIFDAQDYPEEGFEVDSGSKDQYIVVGGKKWKEFKIKIKVVEQHDQLLVDGCGIINIPEAERMAR